MYFVQGATDLSSGLPHQPIQYLLKEDLRLTAAQIGFTWAAIGFGWTIKPLYGLLLDFSPFTRNRHRGYLILVSVVGLAGWTALSYAPHTYSIILVLLVCASACLAFSDVITDGLMVKNGKALDLVGAFQSIQWAALGGALTLSHLVGGYLAENASPRTAFLFCTVFPLFVLLATVNFYNQGQSSHQPPRRRLLSRDLKAFLRSRRIWTVAGFLFLWNFSPIFGTPLLFYQRDVLEFSKLFIGVLGSIANAAGMIGAIAFFFLFRDWEQSRLLRLAVSFGVLSTLSFIGLVGNTSATLIFLGYGFLSQVTHLSVLLLAARACPLGLEATVFALLMSVLNLGRSASFGLGGWLYDEIGFVPLVLISGTFTGLCWFLIPLLLSRERQCH